MPDNDSTLHSVFGFLKVFRKHGKCRESLSDGKGKAQPQALVASAEDNVQRTLSSQKDAGSSEQRPHSRFNADSGTESTRDNSESLEKELVKLRYDVRKAKVERDAAVLVKAIEVAGKIIVTLILCGTFLLNSLGGGLPPIQQAISLLKLFS